MSFQEVKRVLISWEGFERPILYPSVWHIKGFRMNFGVLVFLF